MMNFTLEIHSWLWKFFRPKLRPPHHRKFKKVPDVPHVPYRTLCELLTPPRLDIHIQAKQSTASLGPRFYSDTVDDFVKQTLWTQGILAVGYETTVEDPVGKHGLDILTDLFELLNGRLDLFTGI